MDKFFCRDFDAVLTKKFCALKSTGSYYQYLYKATIH